MKGAGEAFDTGFQVPTIGVLDEVEEIVEFLIRPLA